MLIKEKNFIKKLENSEVSALVILDDTPRYLEFGNFLQFFMGNVGSVKKTLHFVKNTFKINHLINSAFILYEYLIQIKKLSNYDCLFIIPAGWFVLACSSLSRSMTAETKDL